MKTGGPIRGFISRWLVRFEASQQLINGAFLGVTAASTLTSALIGLEMERYAPHVLIGGLVATPLFAFAYVELGVFNRKNRERQDRGDNFAGPGLAMHALLHGRQRAALAAGLAHGADGEELVERIDDETRDLLREFRDGIDLDGIYDHERADDLRLSERPRPSADGGRVVAVPECTDCDRRAVPGTHKDSPTWVCPGCGDILFRDIQ